MKNIICYLFEIWRVCVIFIIHFIVLYFILQDQWHLRRHAHQIYKLGLVQLMVMFCGCNPSMFQNMFGMGNQTENYTSAEKSRRIKVKNKYRRKLFLCFGNGQSDRK